MDADVNSFGHNACTAISEFIICSFEMSAEVEDVGAAESDMKELEGAGRKRGWGKLFASEWVSRRLCVEAKTDAIDCSHFKVVFNVNRGKECKLESDAVGVKREVQRMPLRSRTAPIFEPRVPRLRCLRKVAPIMSLEGCACDTEYQNVFIHSHKREKQHQSLRK